MVYSYASESENIEKQKKESAVMTAAKKSFLVKSIEENAHILDPLRDRIGPATGKVELTIWRPTDETWTTFERRVNVYQSLPAAIRGTKKAIEGYGKENEQLNLILMAVHNVHQIFIDWMPNQWVDKGTFVAGTLFRCFDILKNCLLPEKLRFAQDCFTVGLKRGHDSRGRVNPSALAAILIAAIQELEKTRLPSIEAIVAFLALRLSVLEFTRNESLYYLQLVREGISQIDLCHVIGKNHSCWYHRRQYQIERLFPWLKGVWGSPYFDLADELARDLQVAHDCLDWKRPNRTLAMQLLKKAELSFSQTPFQVETVKHKCVALTRSRNWKNHDSVVVQVVEKVTAWLDASKMTGSIRQPIRHSLQLVLLQIKREDWDKANTHLAHAIERCEW